MTERQTRIVDSLKPYFKKADNSWILKIWDDVKNFYKQGIQEFIDEIKKVPTLAEDINRVVMMHQQDNSELRDGEIGGVVKGLTGGPGGNNVQSFVNAEPVPMPSEIPKSKSFLGETQEPKEQLKVAPGERDTKSLLTSDIYRGYQPVQEREFDPKVGEIQARVVQALGATEWRDLRKYLGSEGIDGLYGDNTKKAVAEWQKKKGYDPTGDLTDDQYVELAKSTTASVEWDGNKFKNVRWR